MGGRRMHITGYLHDGTRDGLYRFIEAACSLRFFTEVIPVRRGDGSVIAVAFFSSSDEDRMPEVVRRLSGILGQDTEIVSAENIPAHHDPYKRAWFIPGRGEAIRGEVVRLELAGGETGREQVPHCLIPSGA